MERRLGFPLKVLGAGGLRSHDTRRWQTGPSIAVSIVALEAVLAYLVDTGIRMYRISSDFVPYATHPDMPQFHGQIEQHAEVLARVGAVAAKRGVRLSLHPSQYVVLNAADDNIARMALADLDSQARLLDALQQCDEAVVVLHIGGVYDDRQASLERFVRNFERLSPTAQRRLVIENDEVAFCIRDVRRLPARAARCALRRHARGQGKGSGAIEAARRADSAGLRGRAGAAGRMILRTPTARRRVK